MERKFKSDDIDLQVMRDFCEREGESVCYERGEVMEREGEPSQWFGFVVEGGFKYVTREADGLQTHATWFSFEGEFVGDYPNSLSGLPAQTTIEAMMPSRVLRVGREKLLALFREDIGMMEMRAVIGEHIFRQYRARYLDFFRANPRERYESLLRRCPGIVDYLTLQDIASFLRSTSGRLACPLVLQSETKRARTLNIS